MANFIVCGWTSEAECEAMIKTCYEQNEYLLDPHTAVGLNVALKRSASARKLLLSSTAHYSKFATHVLLALGKKPNSDSPRELFEQLEELYNTPVMHECLKNAMRRQEINNYVCLNDMNAVKDEIENFLMNLTAI